MNDVLFSGKGGNLRRRLLESAQVIGGNFSGGTGLLHNGIGSLDFFENTEFGALTAPVMRKLLL